jgi:hypothetical protein
LRQKINEDKQNEATHKIEEKELNFADVVLSDEGDEGQKPYKINIRRFSSPGNLGSRRRIKSGLGAQRLSVSQALNRFS